MQQAGNHLPRGKVAFDTTRWSLVAAAAKPSSESNTALAELCQAYWYPLYAFIRRRGHNAEEACDLTQGFFTRLIEKNDLAAADAARGRFRTFLLCSLGNFLCNHHDQERAVKRGGDTKHLSLSMDPADAEWRYQLDPVDGATPEKLFDRQWALSLLEAVLAATRGDYEAAGNATLFDALKGALTFAPDPPSYEQLAAGLEMTPGAVKVAVHRLRNRYRQRLRGMIADSVASEEDVQDEIRHLFEALSRER